MNKNIKQMQELLIEGRAKQNALIYQLAKEQLFIFNMFVLEVEKDKMPLGEFHHQLCNFVQDNKHKKKLILIPRGHLKSTLITIGYSTQQIINNPNVRILILNATWQLAVDFLTEIKNNLTKNEKLIELYGELAQNPTEWAQDRITIQRSASNIKGPTVWASGIDGNLTGSHPDLIIMDDVVSRDNTQTIEQIEKVKLRYKDALDLLEPGGQLIVIGTRYTYADFYSWILDPDEGIKQSYDIMIKRAYEGDLKNPETFSALWPAKFNQKELKTRLREKGSYEFNAQYMNDPVTEETANFKRGDFQYYNPEDYRGAKWQTIMTIDPALSLKKEADFTAMGVFSVDQFTNIFVRDLTRGHWKPSQIIDMMFYVYELYHPTSIVLETVAYQKALAYSLQDEMRRRGKFLPIIEQNYHEKSKVERIKGLQPLYQNKKVFHRKELSLNNYLEEELLKFPYGRRDDLIDCFSMGLDYFVAPARPRVSRRYHAKYLY